MPRRQLLAQLEDEVCVLQQHHLHAAQLLAQAELVGHRRP